ncbi:alcohol dehydrogenase [Talaromyces islandicus]|uniref:Alcohol dehydrogenase n=1 Tax=Talaromyces islandicus TaxID=28573 RepID=A0A0U1M115_TALIS|nr:alcohol dehydrogenase [Talaromyces islandicus]
MSLPQKQLCAWVQTPGPEATIEFRNIEVPTTGPGEVLVKLEVSGVCHSDHHSIYGNTPMTTHIAGHEGVGTIVEVGPNVSGELLNRRVGVSWLHRACGKCEICKTDYTHCPHQDNSGRNVSGTFQEYCVADADYVFEIPAKIPSATAAPLLCGGITMYGALARADLHAGDFVVIPGAGGGLGHLGVQISNSMGLQVIAIDSGPDKEAICMESGARHFFDFRHSGTSLVDHVRSVTGGIGAHAVLCITGAPSAYDSALPMLRSLGKLVCVGIPPASYRLAVNPFEMLVRGLRIIGSTVGNKSHMSSLMDLVLQGKIKPTVQVYEFSELPDVMKHLENATVAGRAVLKIQN